MDMQASISITSRILREIPNPLLDSVVIVRFKKLKKTPTTPETSAGERGLN